VFVCFSEDYIKEHYHSGIIQYRHAAEKREYIEDRSPAVFLKDHQDFMSKCVEQNINYFSIHSNYVVEMNQVYDYICNKLESK